MARKMDVDWSDWDGKVKQPEHPLSKPLGNIKNGTDSVVAALSKGDLPVLMDAPKQPTDEEMFGHLVVSEEQVQKAEKDWENLLKDSMSEARKPIDHRNTTRIKGNLSGVRSFNDIFKEELTPQEMAERNKAI